MPFVEGESLRDRLRRERQLSVDDALRIGTEAARASTTPINTASSTGHQAREHHAHQRRSTLVADFGIARALGATTGSPRPASRSARRPT